MATRSKSRKSPGSAADGAPATMVNALHQIYLAGLGAASRARSGAPQLFDQLISEGARIHSEQRGAAAQALQEWLGDARTGVRVRVGQMRGQAADALEGLEKMFQTRVHRALTQLGVPSAEELVALSKRVDALNANIEHLARRAPRPVRTRVAARRPSTRPSPAP